MGSWSAFRVVVAMGLSLAACSKQGEDVAAGGKPAHGSTATTMDVLAALPSKTKSARFAASPDRGELLRYDARPAERDGAYTWHRTELSERHALDAIASGTLRVKTPDGQVLGFRYDRSIRHDDTGDWTWIGHLPGQAGVQAILTFGAGAVFGSIGQPAARPLRLTMRDGASWLVETDPVQLAGLASHAANPVSPDYQIVSPAAMKRLLAARPAAVAAKPVPVAQSAAAIAAVPTVDVVVGYTQGFVTAQGGVGNVGTRLNYMVDFDNNALFGSMVNGRIRLVHTMQVNYTDTNTNDVALGQLTGYDSDKQQETTPNAAFNALRAAREQYGADLVSLVRPFRDPEQDGCGIGWLVGGGKQPVTANNGWDFFGYSVVGDGTDRNEQDGKTYFCEDQTLAHELAHNMGSQHDRETAKGDDGVLDNPDDYGAFDYSFGYKTAAGGKTYYTIMAYGDSGEVASPYFSNPQVFNCPIGGVAGGAGNPCGVANSEDNARSLNNLLPIVAQFRATVAADVLQLAAARRIDANGNARADLFFYNHSTGRVATWFMSGTSRTATSSSVIPAAFSVVGTGAFNADGKDDLLIRDAGALYIAMSNGTTFALQAVDTPAMTDLQPVDVADIDGNGKSDVVLRNTFTGQVVVWYMSNGVRTAYKGTAFSPTLSYVLAADFNNDKKADLLFQDGQRNLFIAISAGTSFTLQPVGLAYASTYALRGATDVSGDGSADILLHDAAANKLVVWYMHGTTRSAYNSMTSPAGAVLVAHGDFDGNKKSDIGWVHPTSGQVWLSLSAGSSFTTSLLAYTFVPATSDPMDLDVTP